MTDGNNESSPWCIGQEVYDETSTIDDYSSLSSSELFFNTIVI